ncbi:MAG: enoyl-CoA hydratase [Peptococcaceae bacterium BRH_c4b]|nr:MAG: enoyl-CoA hydratase [Peptococcaceae bacterium BRH_c4b]
METILVERRGPVGIITLNRPNKMNALNKTVVDELTKVITEFQQDKEVRAVIITGGESVFGAGADIDEIAALAGVFDGYNFSRKSQDLFSMIENLSKPVIAAITGVALGGCLELALACDIRIASDNARMGLPEINLGLLPGAGGTQRLPRLVGPGQAKWMLFSGRTVKALEALQIGLVQQVVPPEELFNTALKMAEELAGKPALALATIKDLVNTGFELDLSRALQYESRGFGLLFDTEDRLEGIQAFTEKRRPDFKHR